MMRDCTVGLTVGQSGRYREPLGKIPKRRDPVDTENLGHPAGSGRGSGVVQPTLERGVFHNVDPAVQTELSHRVGFVRLDSLDAER
jgi:hypothetical protein